MKKIIIYICILLFGISIKYVFDIISIRNEMKNNQIDINSFQKTEIKSNKKIGMYLASIKRIKPEESEDEINGECLVYDANNQRIKKEYFPSMNGYWIINQPEKVWGYTLGAPNQYQFYVGNITNKITVSIRFMEADSDGPFGGNDLLGTFHLIAHENGQIDFQNRNSAPSAMYNSYNGTKTVDVTLKGSGCHYVVRIGYEFF